MPIPADKKLYEKVKKKIYAIYKVPSAYRCSGLMYLNKSSKNLSPFMRK